MSHALIHHEELVKKYFAKCISVADHKFSALHYAVWS
jgi:feS assembly protein sufB